MVESEIRKEEYTIPLREFFYKGTTRDVDCRIGRLKALRRAITGQMEEINAALWRDLRKSGGESYLTEIGMVLGEIDYHVKHLRQWVKPRRLATPLAFWPSKSRIMYEPYGVVLIIAPWNYPFQLLLEPLIGAISAGNCAVLKPSPFAPATAEVIKKIIAAVFEPGYVSVFDGEGDVVEQLLRDGGETFNPSNFGVGRKKSLYRGAWCEREDSSSSYGLGKVYQCRADVCCPRLRVCV